MSSKITDISIQARNPDRVNVSIDGSYRLSLDITQVTDLGIKVGCDISQEELAELEQESRFGKLYARALDYVMMRPHSAKEVRDYLWRKTLTRKVRIRAKKPGEVDKVIERPGVSQAIADRVYNRLLERGYIDDETFTRYWLENRNLTKGTSRRKLTAELRSKGVEPGLIERLLAQVGRDDRQEIDKVIAKKRSKYDDVALRQYLLRQGYDYDLVDEKIRESTEE